MSKDSIDATLASLQQMVEGKFPKGKSVDVPKYLREHGNPEAAEEWVAMNEEYGDMLKKEGNTMNAYDKLKDLTDKTPEGQGSLLPGMEPEIKKAKKAINVDDEAIARFEEGKPADPTENMSPEDKKKWNKQKELNKDKFKTAMDKLEQEILIDQDIAKLAASNIVYVSVIAKNPKGHSRGKEFKFPWKSKDGDLVTCCPHAGVVQDSKSSKSVNRIDEKKGYLREIVYTIKRPDELKDIKGWEKDIKAFLDEPGKCTVEILPHSRKPQIWFKGKPVKRASNDEMEARFEEGKPADPTENMNKEDAKKWRLENLKNRNNFDKKKANSPDEDIDTAFKQLAEALKTTALPTADNKYRTLVEPSEFMLEGSTKDKWSFKHQVSLNLLTVNKETGKIIIPTGDTEDLGGSFDKYAALTSYHILDNLADMKKLATTLRMKLSRPMPMHGYSTSWSMDNKDLEVQISFEKNGKVDLYILPSLTISNSQEPLFEKEQMVIRSSNQLKSLVTKAVQQTLKNPMLKQIERTAKTPSGLYGYTRKIQGDCEACIRKTTKTATKLAKMAWQKDNAVAQFLAAHAKRSDSLPAKILVEAMKGLGPKVSSKEIAGRRNGLYGFRPKTAALGMKMCSSLRIEVGHFASDLHKRRSASHENITGFLKQHSKEAKCMYSRILRASYPDAPTLKKASKPNSVQGWLELNL